MTASPAADPFGLCAADYFQDPYPAFARLRAEAPVHFDAGWNGWLVTRFGDVVSGFRDTRLSADRAAGYAQKLPPPVQEKLRPLISNLSCWALLADPPKHTRLRGLINKAFTSRVAEELRGRIQRRVSDLLDAATAGGGSFDLIRALANPLPVAVIGELLGLPREDDSRLKKWSDALATFLGSKALTQEVVGAALLAIVELEDYFRARIQERRSRPGPDLLSGLLAAEEQGTILDERELLATCALVLFGGHETTTNLIGNGVYHLLRHPDSLALLRAHPDVIESAVEELLRFDAPVLRMGRIALQDFDWAGQPIKQGDRVFLVMASANRDASHFADPDNLDLRRRDNRHLSLGFGPHYCVGAPLGRVEAQIAISSLFQRFPGLALKDSGAAPTFFPNLTIRGLESLPLMVS